MLKNQALWKRTGQFGAASPHASQLRLPMRRSLHFCTSRRPRAGRTSAYLPVNEVPLQTQEQIVALLQPLAFQFSNPFAKPAPNAFSGISFSNPADAIHFQSPSFFGILSFLLANPIVTFVLAVSLYILVPRLWRWLVRYVFIPAGLLGAGVVVFKNPAFFSNAGSFVAGFSTDHPYITSAAILGALAIVLSPYVLTAVFLLLVFTGVPKLPAPLRGFVPAPFLEVEQQIRTADSFIRGPVEEAKGKAFETTLSLKDRGLDFFGKKVQELQQPAPRLSQAPTVGEIQPETTSVTRN